MIAGGADLQTVRERLGHASLRATERYLHSLPDTDDTALDALATVRNGTELHRPARRGSRHRHVTVTDMRNPSDADAEGALTSGYAGGRHRD
jgi:hypothetical protein